MTATLLQFPNVLDPDGLFWMAQQEAAGVPLDQIDDAGVVMCETEER